MTNVNHMKKGNKKKNVFVDHITSNKLHIHSIQYKDILVGITLKKIKIKIEEKIIEQCVDQQSD